jgi:hypothetical protein
MSLTTRRLEEEKNMTPKARRESLARTEKAKAGFRKAARKRALKELTPEERVARGFEVRGLSIKEINNYAKDHAHHLDGQLATWALYETSVGLDLVCVETGQVVIENVRKGTLNTLGLSLGNGIEYVQCMPA